MKTLAILDEMGIGHASVLNERLMSMLCPDAGWRISRQPFAAAADWLHIGPVKHEARLLGFLALYRGGVSMLLPHAFPHECPEIRRRMLLAIYRRCQMLFVPTQKVADILAAHGVQRQCLHVLGGYPCQTKLALAGGRVGNKMDCRLLMAGYLDKDSGVDRLPALLKQCRDRGMKVSLIAAGCMQTSVAKALAGAGAEVRPGFLSEAHYHALLAQADMLLLPYRKRVDTPQAQMAMEHGLPVLRTPQVADWNGKTDMAGQALAWRPLTWSLALEDSLARLKELRAQALRCAMQSRQRLFADILTIRSALDARVAAANVGGLHEWRFAGNHGRAGAFQPRQGFVALD